MLSIRAAALSDIGRVRRENEDRYLFDEKAFIFGVADGVGGLPGGAEAAQLTVDEIAGGLYAQPNDKEPNLVTIVQHANEMVGHLGAKLSPAMGIGSTLTFGVFSGDKLRIGHVGDSRAYAARGREFSRLTEDHSVENEARMRRARGEVVYYHEANRNALTRCIGQPSPLEVDVFSETLAAGDRVLFCTDGITRLVPDRELGEMLAAAASPQAAVESLVQLAVRRGGPDNATAVALFADAG